MPKISTAGRNLALEAVRGTEAAALAASRLMGRGDDQAADRAAVDAMHEALKMLAITGTIRIGEGAEDDSPKLYVGETVGTGDGPRVDVAAMPLEGSTIIAKGEPNALSVIAIAEGGGFLNIPDIYMEKIAIGGGLPEDVFDLEEEPAKNLGELARAKGVDARFIEWIDSPPTWPKPTAGVACACVPRRARAGRASPWKPWPAGHPSSAPLLAV